MKIGDSSRLRAVVFAVLVLAASPVVAAHRLGGPVALLLWRIELLQSVEQEPLECGD